MKNKSSPVATQQQTKNASVTENPWQVLCDFTDARIALGRAGISLPTSKMLAFQLAHAQAKDAVNLRLNSKVMSEQLLEFSLPTLCLHSQATDRSHYLQRPDLGRKLNQASREKLVEYMSQTATTENLQHDIAIIVVDGLSALAVQQNARPFIRELNILLNEQALNKQAESYSMAPITLVEQGRVAIGDDIGERLNAKLAVVLIGERPGLSSPDSLGVYLTWEPKNGLNDAQRNCISNIRPAGLSYQEAARRTLYLLNEAKRLKLSGVNLKDRSQDDVLEHPSQTRSMWLK